MRTDERNYHHGDLRNALLHSALEILESEGLEAMSLRAVARRAGVSQAAPYHHFKDKRALIAGVSTIGHIMLADTARTFRDMGGEGYASLIRMGAGYVAFAKENPNLFRLMFGPELTDYTGDQDYIDATKAGRSLIRTKMGEVMKIAGDPTAEMIENSTTVAWCFVHGLATLVVDNKIPSPEVDDPRFLDFIFGLFAVVDRSDK
jgi:AcrR family transcriptional regulator